MNANSLGEQQSICLTK